MQEGRYFNCVFLSQVQHWHFSGAKQKSFSKIIHKVQCVTCPFYLSLSIDMSFLNVQQILIKSNHSLFYMLSLTVAVLSSIIDDITICTIQSNMMLFWSFLPSDHIMIIYHIWSNNTTSTWSNAWYDILIKYTIYLMFL